MKQKGFFAYAAEPRDIGDTIESSIQKVNSKGNVAVESWKALDIVGHFISEQVVSKIEECDFLLADISILNFNVTYEIGYAIGKGKRVLLVKNSSIRELGLSIRDVGIFDTIGYSTYENSDQLSSFIDAAKTVNPLKIPNKINSRSPVYLLEGQHKTDYATRIVSRIKKAKYLFRSFDPNEQPRLSANDAISQVAQSHGVVVPLLSSTANGGELNNMRGAFIAGLSDGMGKALCLIQNGEEPVPLDYRDFVKTIYHPNDINEFIAEFAGNVAEAFQEGITLPDSKTETLICSSQTGHFIKRHFYFQS